MVHLPAGYQASKQRYPVLYLLDPEEHFLHVSGVVDFLASRGQMPPMIVVGIANTERDRDLTPAGKVTTFRQESPALRTTISNEINGSGGANQFLAVLKTEVIPEIAKRYRIADYRVLAGHSFGGLFAVNVLVTDPSAFNAYIAASPSLWWDEEALVKRLGKQFPELGTKPRWLYMTTGAHEGGAMLGGLDNLSAVLDVSAPATLRWSTSVLQGSTHGMTPHQAFYDGLMWLFADYALSENVAMTGDLGRVEAHFAKASRLYGIDLSPTEELVNGMGYTQMMIFKNAAKAVGMFRRNVALHPGSANARDSLADGLEAIGMNTEGVHEREEAVRLAAATNDPQVGVFTANLERARERMAKKPK